VSVRTALVALFLAAAIAAGGAAGAGNGGRFVFQRFSDRHIVPGGIYVMAADGTGEKRVPGQPGESGGPRWSPDGRTIAFFSLSAAGTSLYTVRPDGSGLRMVLAGKAPSHEPFYPDWSPDGQKLAFLSGHLCQQGVCNARLSILDLAGGSVSDVADASNAYLAPAWSPDGSEIAFGTRTGIWVVRPDGSGLKRISSPGFALAPSWSPDGHSVVYSTVAPAGTDIDIVPRNGGKPRLLNKTTGDFATPVWSPDGRRIAFIQGGGADRGRICIMSLRGTFSCLPHNAAVDDELPDWAS
jgi:Tol biopolymer transport system component